MLRIIFSILFYLGVSIVCIIFLPTLILPQKFSLYGGKLIGLWSKFCLKYLLSVDVIVKGKENIINDEKFFVACTHQSAFETYFLQVIYKNPLFILKKELIKIPIFGWYLKKIGSIAVQRDKVSKENIGFIDKIKKNYEQGSRPVIIFPQGTRKDLNDRSPFKKGVIKIYNKLNIKCQPVVLNSGAIWPKKGSMSYKKKLYISILKPIEPGMNDDQFINCLQENMYNELEKFI
tara:strand:- start:1888 stop:2586 length:699 start_codon:yes stop_codon:yes gene_type:complete